MADVRRCKAVLLPVARKKFAELCPAAVPFAEAVILGTSRKLDVIGNDDDSFILGCETSASFLHRSTLPNSQQHLLLNACTSSAGTAVIDDLVDAYGSRDWYTNKDRLVTAISDDALLRPFLENVDCFWVKKSRGLPLQKVVLGVTSDKIFAWTEKHLSPVLFRCSGNCPILLRKGSAFPLPTRENVDSDLFTACKSLFVLHCEPIQQGIITSETEIILSKMNEETFCMTEQAFDRGEEPSAKQSEPLATFLVSEFTTPLREFSHSESHADFKRASVFTVEVTMIPHLDAVPEMFNGVPADGCNRIYVTVETLMSMSLLNGSWVNVWRQDVQRKENGRQTRTPGFCGRDIVGQHPRRNVEGDLQGSGLGNETNDAAAENECSVTEEHSDQFGVRTGEGTLSETSSGECCNTDPEQNTATKGPTVHTVQLVAVDEKYSGLLRSQTKPDPSNQTGETQFQTKHQALTSPSLLFNLCGRESFCTAAPKHSLLLAPVEPRLKEVWIRTGTEDHPPKTSSNQAGNPPFATEAHVAQISSPASKSSEIFDLALTRHFQTSRLLTVGDVFSVNWDWRDENSGIPEGQKERNGPIYFQVTRLVHEGSHLKSAFIDVKHSSLYQRGLLHAYVPAVADAGDHPVFFPLGPDCRACGNLLSPPGLEGSVQKLCDMVEPYLSQSCTLSPTGILLTGPEGVGKRAVVKAARRRLCLHYVEINCYDLIGDSVAATEARIRNVFQRGIASSPCIMLMRNIDALGKDREGSDEPRIAVTFADCISNLPTASAWPVVVIAACTNQRDISSDLLPCFLHETCLEAPNEDDRYCMLAGLMESTTVADDVPLRQLAKRTAGMVAADLTALFSQASCVASRRILESFAEQDAYPRSVLTTWEGFSGNQFPLQLEQDICEAGVSVLWQDLENALDILQAAQSDAIGAPKIPNVKWEDVGGLADVKAEILDTVQLPLQHPELFASGLRRSGVLLYGPPGTGKTLLAKAVATECSLNFLSVKGPELINMYVGQSEQNVREVFARAQTARPCVIFFDELDSLAPNRGRSGDSGGVMDRVVSQLLAELDGLHKACDVFVIGATNRPDLLDPALLRPGRFDKMMYLGISEDRSSQLQILRALTRKFHLDTHFRLEEFVTTCPENLTGADFYALCSDAMLHSIKRQIHSLEAGQDVEEGEDTVTREDFKAALDQLVPSVSTIELERYRQLQKEFAPAASPLHSRR